MSEPLLLTEAAPERSQPPPDDFASPAMVHRVESVEPVGGSLRVGPLFRLACLWIAAGCLFVWSTAAGLTPDPSGLGTHRALGLSGCGFHASTGVPCMTCGMTTAFAHWARGNPAAAFAAQPMGALLAAATAAAAVLGVWTALTGWFWKPLFILLTGQRFWISVSMLWGLSWVYKVAAVRFGG